MFTFAVISKNEFVCFLWEFTFWWKQIRTRTTRINKVCEINFAS